MGSREKAYRQRLMFFYEQIRCEQCDHNRALDADLLYFGSEVYSNEIQNCIGPLEMCTRLLTGNSDRAISDVFVDIDYLLSRSPVTRD